MQAIRRILVDDWDPIGIQGAGPEDEYDAYIGGLYRLLIRRPTEDEIVAHLEAIEMVPTDAPVAERADLSAVARKLLGVPVAIR